MTTTTTPATTDRTRVETIYLVRELIERPEFDETVERKVRLRHNHTVEELNLELPAWRATYEESLENGRGWTAMYALADIQAIGKVLHERGAW